METAKRSTKLEEARRRWGAAVTITQNDRDGLVISLQPGRLSRVVEQIRDISQHKLDRSTNP